MCHEPEAAEIHGQDDIEGEGYLRVSETVIECVRLPLVPVILMLYVPLGDFPEVDRVNVTFVPVVDNGLNEPEVLAGKPVAVNATDPVNPLNRVIVTP